MSSKEKRGPRAEAAFPISQLPAKATAPIVRKGCEWKVEWRRAGWATSTMTKSRTFGRPFDALRFIERLEAGDRVADYSPATVTLHRRPVGAWTEVDR